MRNLIKKHFANPDRVVEKTAEHVILEESILFLGLNYAQRSDKNQKRCILHDSLGRVFDNLVRVKAPFLLLLCALFLCNCARTHAPRGWLSQPKKTQTDVFGGWITVEYAAASGEKAQLAGELIAVSSDSVFIATEQLFTVAQSDIQSARLATYNANSGPMGGLVALGTLSTISNGFYLVFTAPLWMIGGSIAAGRRSFEPILEFPEVKFQNFAPYARYPQGLPPEIERRQIRMKKRRN